MAGGFVSKIRGSKNLREFEDILAGHRYERMIDVARLAAEALTELAAASYDAGRTVFDDVRVRHASKKREFKGRTFKGRSATGKRKGPTDLSLVQSGATRATLKFAPRYVDPISIRATLTTDWAKYLVGKYKVLPCGNSAMPFKWSDAIGLIAQRYLDSVFGARA